MKMNRLLKSIEDNEGFRPWVYDDYNGKRLEAGDDVKGVPTIGHGITNVTATESRLVVKEKVHAIIDELRNRLSYFDALSDNEQEVLIEMAYQLGVDGLFGFKKMLAYIEKQDFLKASEEGMDSLWAKQTPHRAQQMMGRLRYGASK